MTDYIDYYWHSADANAFLPVLAIAPNMIGPKAGGDGFWYAAIRSATALELPAGCSVTDSATAQNLLGVWA